jgi:hypothetical protein
MLKVLLILVIFSMTVFAQTQEGEVACPSIAVTGPSGVPRPGQEMFYTAEIGKEIEQYSVEYVWSTSIGKIMSGQGSKAIIVITDDVSDVVVTLEVKGLPANCPKTSSERGTIPAEPLAPVLLNEFDTFGLSGTKAQLDEFFIELQKDPVAEGYVVFLTKKDILTRVKFLQDHALFRQFQLARLTLIISDENSKTVQFYKASPFSDFSRGNNDLAIKIEDFAQFKKLFTPAPVKSKRKK